MRGDGKREREREKEREREIREEGEGADNKIGKQELQRRKVERRIPTFFLPPVLHFHILFFLFSLSSFLRYFHSPSLSPPSPQKRERETYIKQKRVSERVSERRREEDGDER